MFQSSKYAPSILLPFRSVRNFNVGFFTPLLGRASSINHQIDVKVLGRNEDAAPTLNFPRDGPGGPCLRFQQKTQQNEHTSLGVAGAYFFRRRAAGPDDLAVKGESTEIEEESKEQPATD